jgi:hypothetical protein
MASKPNPNWLVDEVAEFLARCPTQKELLAHRASTEAQDRYAMLVAKTKSGSLSTDEEWELNQFEHLEMLMQSIKARLRSRRMAV